MSAASSGLPESAALPTCRRTIATCCPAIPSTWASCRRLCDEVGGARDAQAVAAGANAGVGLVVTIHGRSMQELRRRPQARALLQTGAFYKVAFLTGESSPGKVAAVRDVDAVF